MSKPIIKINNLSKCYRIGTKEKGYKTFREAIIDGIRAPFRNFKQLQRLTKFNNNGDDEQSNDIFWALKDISFEIDEGEVLGIIGKNGAGKSTLLKILSRITEPTSGVIEINGRVSSLLEVGTGFHPELTGRENIFLNGAILGMRKKEIEQKFDEIVNFAEIEKFLDTPVKRYSSGMYVRLAFAVAAHLEPEVLLVDEVLAVGDIAFQKKCLGKMGEVAKGGRTVLFVSHNIGAVNTLCNRTILLDKGRVSKIGNTSDIVDLYLMEKSISDRAEVVISNISNDDIAFTKVWISDINGNITNCIDVKKPFMIWLEYLVRKPNDKAEISIFIRNSHGVQVIFSSISDSLGGSFHRFEPGKYISSILINANFLLPDIYFLKVSAHYRGIREIDAHENILRFEIIESGSVMAPYGNAAKQLCCVLGGTKWELVYSEPFHVDLTKRRDEDNNAHYNK